MKNYIKRAQSEGWVSSLILGCQVFFSEKSLEKMNIFLKKENEFLLMVQSWL